MPQPSTYQRRPFVPCANLHDFSRKTAELTGGADEVVHPITRRFAQAGDRVVRDIDRGRIGAVVHEGLDALLVCTDVDLCTQANVSIIALTTHPRERCS
jgi:NAD(P)-dependent dehydrogenase (short-subunit alcohol dehydrogenase family)